ncbi:MAG: hypothetical protein JAY85_10885 [Candidatus Thiodiazotropha weberae]|uniref:Uncharacterized protein n=1 Tax=Candidatus Thiodiazotropha endoloripes TaxID=1818881 RepID=A0A1E2UPE7_9GAMM|nr:hypothetical protein [Candidatus Thiodiazotropha endoloripes]MCG7898950.1 hypothetical protein [Candidatus Thiodiazotropha weberae]ODB96402.1 hypothetical protein A3196_06305 [Candidatus Thiodiazotropha endoloripes]
MKEIPEGLWLLLALTDSESELRALENKYGKLGGGSSKASIDDLYAFDLDIFLGAVEVSLHTISQEMREKWDPVLLDRLYKEDKFRNERDPREKAFSTFLDWLNTGLRFEEVIVQAEWEGATLVLKPLTRTLLAKAWLQLYEAMSNPVPWKQCDYCKTPFPIRRKGAIYCSDSCRAGAYKKRKGILK